MSIHTAAILSSRIDLSKTIICADLAVMVTDGLPLPPPPLPLCFAAASLEQLNVGQRQQLECVSSTPALVITAIRLHHGAMQPLYYSVSDAGQREQLFDRAIHYTVATISSRRAWRSLLWINGATLDLNMSPLSPLASAAKSAPDPLFVL